MSNLGQFYGSGFPIGSVLQMSYGGDLLTASDGSQWIATTPTSPFAYTSDYSYLPNYLTSPHPLMNGWENGLFRFVNASVIAYSPSGVYCTNALYGSGFTSGFNYYTSSDGVNWTLRLFPNLINYPLVVYVAGKFFAVANGTTTSAIIHSTDAISWTTANLTTGVNPATDIVYNGSNLVLTGTGTTAAYSANLGVSWTNVTLPSSAPNIGGIPGSGASIWSQSAGLFIVASTTSGTYSTSPNGITWTHRNNIESFLPYASALTNNTKFAASNSIIVAMGTSGFYLTSTNGLSWTGPNYIPGISSSSCQQLYHDGTRFVARFGYGVYYSTNGTAWFSARQIGAVVNTSPTAYSNGVLFCPCGNGGASIPSKLFKVTDVTLTTPQTISAPTLANLPAGAGGSGVYYRIR